jgi:arylsulfatase A
MKSMASIFKINNFLGSKSCSILFAIKSFPLFIALLCIISCDSKLEQLENCDMNESEIEMFGHCNEYNSDQPNFIVILADDLGYNDLKNFNTPNLDRLYNEGFYMPRFYTAAVCTPSRVAALTGRYPQHYGRSFEKVLSTNQIGSGIGLNSNTKTLFEYLNDAGYRTAMFGKWHLGWEPQFSPSKFGFDEWVGLKSGNIDYFSKLDNQGNYDWYKNDELFLEEGYATDLITNHAINFINENRCNRFALYLPHLSPHSPYQSRDTGPVRLSNVPATDWKQFSTDPNIYRRMIESLDTSIGLLLDQLECQNLLENTLIFFSSDNGLSKNAEPMNTNSPLKHWKGSLYEGGVLSPATLFWQGHIQPQTFNYNAHLTDVLPTILSQINLEPSVTDGLNLLDSDNLDSLDNRKLYQRLPISGRKEQKSVVWKRWKYLVDESDNGYLFDLGVDISEKTNLKTVEDSVYQALQNEYLAWKTNVGFQ